MITWLSFAALAGTPDRSDSLIQEADAPVALRLFADLGATGQLSHRLQFGNDGTEVRVPGDLGQDLLYPFVRLQADLDLGRAHRHTVSFLYQPLNFQSVVAPANDLTVGDLVFPAGDALQFRYSFPFYRLTWMYDLAASTEREVAFGVALQIRNVSIQYASLDGSQALASRDVGPVPLLAGRFRGPVSDRLWWAGEVTGFYAPVSVLNGSDLPIVGAVVDASGKIGLRTRGPDVYAALRFIGGGSTGTSDQPDPFAGDGFLFNWLYLGTLSLGVELR
ncbi:MAG: hypothetical protein AAGA48_35275 [Myxococcota bacterium]